MNLSNELVSLVKRAQLLEAQLEAWKTKAAALEVELTESKALAARAANIASTAADTLKRRNAPPAPTLDVAALDAHAVANESKRAINATHGKRSHKKRSPEARAAAGDQEVDRQKQRRRERNAVPFVECPHCGAKPKALCVDDETDRKMRGTFHGERYGEARRVLAAYDRGLTTTCGVCGARPGVACSLDHGKSGMHDARMIAKQGVTP